MDGLDKIIIADTRRYPQRAVEEPDKEKNARGAKDGFTESIMENLGMIRRRIRDNRLIFKNFTVGEKSRTDVAVCYMKGSADMNLVERIEKGLSEIIIDSVSIGDQTIVEQLIIKLNGGKRKLRLNPFPKVRYTQRPDIICAHLTEGKIALIVDTSPTAILPPVGIFDFTQDVDDYYFPLITGKLSSVSADFQYDGHPVSDTGLPADCGGRHSATPFHGFHHAERTLCTSGFLAVYPAGTCGGRSSSGISEHAGFSRNFSFRHRRTDSGRVFGQLRLVYSADHSDDGGSLAGILHSPASSFPTESNSSASSCSSAPCFSAGRDFLQALPQDLS